MTDRPWENEPDQLDLVLNGFRCEIKRGPVGALLGYIDLPAGHPLFGHEYENVDVAIHGGWTFGMEGRNGVWRIGFDCAHPFDLIPLVAEKIGTDHLNSVFPDVYRTIEFVQEELERATAELFGMMSAHQKMAARLEMRA